MLNLVSLFCVDSLVPLLPHPWDRYCAVGKLGDYVYALVVDSGFVKGLAVVDASDPVIPKEVNRIAFPDSLGPYIADSSDALIFGDSLILFTSHIGELYKFLKYSLSPDPVHLRLVESETERITPQILDIEILDMPPPPPTDSTY